MPRQDINFNATYGEVNTIDNLTNKIIYPFVFMGEVGGMDNEHYCYGEIIVPPKFETRYKDKNGIHIHIPYYPIFKMLVVRFRMENGDGSIEYLLNKTNNSQWYTVYMESEEGKINICLSEFQQYNENGNFNLLLKDGYLALYSGNETDFVIKAALRQNEVFLLKTFAGNLYQYPTTGVGLIEYLHGNFENAGLAAKLQHEFDNDRMIIINALMNTETGELHLEVREKGEEDEVIEEENGEV